MNTAWVCSGCQEYLEGMKGTFHKSSSSSPIPCEDYRRWYIKAPHGSYVELTFDSFDAGEASCFSDRMITS